jgi:CNT family concentrative nucleoside transporter
MDKYNLVSLLGLFILLGVAWLLSADRGKIQLRTVAAGVAIQLCFGVFVFLLPAGSWLFMRLSNLVVKILDASRAGILFCFGPLAIPPGEEGSLGFILVFQALPTIVFFAALMEILYHLRVLPFILKLFSRVFTWLMRVSGAESLCATSNIFVGIESATTVRPYLGSMTRSELCTIFTAFLATIASSVLGLYVILLQGTFPKIAGHLISASLLSAPAAIVMSKMLLPEAGRPETLGLAVEPQYERRSNVLDAAIQGATAGGKLVMGIIVVLLAFLGLVALVNMGLGWLSGVVSRVPGIEVSLRLENLLAWLFYPFALVIGVPPADALEIARLLGERAIMTEVPAYQHLSELIAADAFAHGRSAVLASYALCGFTHVASLAIFIGGISALAPGQTRTLSQIAVRAFAAATLACLMTAAVAGIFYGKGSLLLAP